MRCIDVVSAFFIIAATEAVRFIYHDTLDALVAVLHSAGEDRNLVRFRKDGCGVYLGQLVSYCLRSPRRRSVLVSEVGQPELAFDFIGSLVRPHWRVE